MRIIISKPQIKPTSTMIRSTWFLYLCPMCPSHYLTALNYRWLSWYNWNGCVSPGRSHANITLSSNDRLMHPNTKSGRREVQLNRSYTAAAGGELKEHSKDTTTEHQQHHSTKKSRTAEENHQHGTKGSQQHSTEGSRQHSAEGSPRRTQQLLMGAGSTVLRGALGGPSSTVLRRASTTVLRRAVQQTSTVLKGGSSTVLREVLVLTLREGGVVRRD